MPVSQQILNLVYLLGACQGVLLSILLWTKYRGSRANYFLAWLILLYSVYVICVFLFSMPKISRAHPHLQLLFDGLPFLFGPLHLMYVGILTNTRSRFAQPNWMHFIPFILFRLYFAQVFFISKEELNKFIAQVDAGNLLLSVQLSNIAVSVQGLTYMIVALRVFSEYRKKIRLAFSSLDKINLTWLKSFTLLALFVWIVVFILNISGFVGVDSQPFFFLIPTLTALYVYATGYAGMFKTEIFLQETVCENMSDAQQLSGMRDSRERKDDGLKYQKSGLTPEKADSVIRRLRLYMENDRAYTNADLTLRDVSEQLKLSPHNISEAINSRLNQNFFDFVNQYRIEEVKKDLLDHSKRHLTILGIALDAGFNSKSGFNSIFKRFTDLTPTEFREQIKN
jgi:AraC-like DNA-binding protein